MFVSAVRLLFFSLLLLMSTAATAQSIHAVTWGFGTDLGIRLPLSEQDHGFSGGLHSLRLDAFIDVTPPEDPQRLGFLGMAGILAEQDRFRFTAGDVFSTSPYYVHLGGLIIFRTHNPHLTFLGGIDLSIYVNANMSTISSGNSGSGGHSYSIDFDSTFAVINGAQRKVLPGISAGLRYEFSERSHWSLYGLVTQQLLSRYEEDVVVSYKIDGVQQMLTLNSKPSYVRLGVLWRMN